MRLQTITILFIASCLPAETRLTVYNDNFAAVKEQRSLVLSRGENEVRISDITAHLEPDSVMVRGVHRPDSIQILEQNYQGDPLSQQLLLRDAEGAMIDFETIDPQTNQPRLIAGRVLRSGYFRDHSTWVGPFGRQYFERQSYLSNPRGGGEPVVEVGGKIRFGLPGIPLFTAPGQQKSLRPTLHWKLWSQDAGEHSIEFSYLTGGMRWEANYNATAPNSGDTFDIVGWATIENRSGKDFKQVDVKLMAGDVARVKPGERAIAKRFQATQSEYQRAPPGIAEEPFDEYHLYSLKRPATVLDREIKQVEFMRAAGVPARRLYVYEGWKRESHYRQTSATRIRGDANYGVLSNSKVWVMLEFQNSAASNLGMPLPAGRVKVYRKEETSEFVGEDQIDHTAVDETLRLYTGNAFDLVGERRQTAFGHNSTHRWADEVFEIKLRNHGKDEVEIRVVEHMYRWTQWELHASSHEYAKTDARTIEFRPIIGPGAEETITYKVHYSW